MRYIVIFLLLANLAYLGWSYFLAPEPVAVATPAARPLLNNGLMLLAEFDAQSQARQIRENGLCLDVGPFSSVDEANAFISAMQGLGFEARLDLTGEPLDAQYRVYLPPYPTQNVASITLQGLSRVLDQAGLEVETYLITRGLLSNAISLGIYTESNAATAVQQRVAALGYPVEIEPIPRSTGVIQVQLRSTDSGFIESPEWPEFTAFGDNLTTSENVCQTIAQANQFP